MTHLSDIERHARSERPQAGFTIMEILVTVVVLGFAFMGGSWASSMTARTKAALEQEALTAPLLAREIRELAMTLPREPSGSVGASVASEVLALDSLVGASFTPPLRADLTSDTTLVGWTQLVNLVVHDLDDLVNATADDPTLGIAEGAAQVYRLDVTILRDGDVAGTFSWFLTG